MTQVNCVEQCVGYNTYMKWEQDALDAISKATALLRPMVRRKVEARVTANGGSVVTLADVTEARRAAGPGTTGEAGVSAEEIERVVAATPQSSVVSQSRYYEVKVCGGAFGCPRAIFDVGNLARKIDAALAGSGLDAAVAARVTGPVLRHHRFSVAISGCPNSCSQPQIHDFGVQGRARVGMGQGPCTRCMECVRACGEDAVAVERSVPVIDWGKCIECGDCALVCPTEALVIEERGFTVLVGGKLGRHPQIARELASFTDESGLMAALAVCVEVFKNEMLPKERMADAVTRLGVERLRRRCAGR